MFRKSAMVGATGALIGVAMILAVVPNGSSEASPSNATFIVPANDGYGVGDCVSSGSACGKVVADAWCEAQGYTRSSSFGMADPAEITGALPNVVSSRPISITCGE